MPYFRVQPERPCNIWSYSDVDGQGQIQRLVFAYDFPSGEPIYRDVPRYFVRRSVGDDLARRGFTGFSRVDVPTIRSREFQAPEGWDGTLEDVQEMVLEGAAGVDDIGRQGASIIVVSQRVLDALREHGLVQARVSDFDPDFRVPTLDELLRGPA